MSVRFLFLDECSYKPLDLAALTGVLISATNYVSVRDSLCQIVADVQPSPPNTIPSAFELHGRDFLTEVEHLHGSDIDSVRLETLQKIVDLIELYDLHVVRVGYRNRSEIAEKMPLDPKLYSLTFFGIENWLQPIMEKELVIPVMDGVPSTRGTKIARKAPRVDPILIRAFAGQVRSTHNMQRYPCIADSISIENFHNMGEPLFGDSAHSVLIQFADVISYLLLQKERAERESDIEVSEYRTAVVEIAKSIPSKRLTAWSEQMRFG